MSYMSLWAISLLFLFSVVHETGGTVWDCQRPWPSLELFIPLFMNKKEPQQQQQQWHRVFLSSFIAFWPFNISDTTIRFVIPEEIRYSRTYREFHSTLYEHYARKLHKGGRGSESIDISLSPQLTKTLDYKDVATNNSDHIRMQLLLFNADNYTTEGREYVGFAEADTMFVNYVDREDIFEDGKPVIHGRVGMDPKHEYHNYVASRSGFWLLGGSKYPEPMRCRNYYPFVIKRSHLQDMRKHILQVHSNHDSVDSVFEEYIRLFNGHLSHQFNVMCTYLWYFKHDDYKWYVHDFNPGSSTVNGSNTSMINATVLSEDKARNDAMMNTGQASFAPKPMVSISSSHHYHKLLDKIALEGYCLSPPFPKFHGDEVKTCSKVTMGIQNSTYFYIQDMHSYSDATYFLNENISAAVIEHMSRYQRIKSCNNTKYDAEILLSMMNVNDIQGLPLMREQACHDLVRRHGIFKESDIYTLPKPIQEKYKNFNCFAFELELIFKSNRINSLNVELSMKRQERRRYREYRSNISFFQLLSSCPEGMVGIGINCTCIDNLEGKGCAYSTLRSFLPPRLVLQEQMQRKPVDILFSKSFSHFLYKKGNFRSEEQQNFPYHSKKDITKTSIGRLLRYNAMIMYNRLGPETVLAAAGSEESKLWSIYEIDYPYHDFRWAWDIPECKSANLGWLCGLKSVSKEETETALDDFMQSHLVHSSDFIQVLESRITNPNNIVQLILYGKILSMISTPSDTVKAYLRDHLLSSKKGRLPQFADVEENKEEDEEDYEDQVMRNKAAIIVPGDSEHLTNELPAVSLHVRHGDACDIFLNTSDDNLRISTNTSDDNWSRKCFNLGVYIEKLQLVREKYGVKKVFLSTDSSDMIELTKKYPEFEWIYLDIPRAAFDIYVNSGLEHHMNEVNNEANNTVFFYSAIADIELLKRGDIFIGTLASHFSKLLYSAMVGYQMRILPFISLDFPMVCDTIDSCSNQEILGRNQTIEEIVLRNPSCERADGEKIFTFLCFWCFEFLIPFFSFVCAAIRSNAFAESGLAGWLRSDEDDCNIYNGPAVQFYQHLDEEIEETRRNRRK